jgi:hypothetical protein
VSALTIALLLFVAVGLLLGLAAVSAWRNRRRLGSLVGVLAALLSLSLAALCGAIAVGIRGYRALTAEEVAATIVTEPIGPRRFRATVTLADGSLHMFDLAGDAVYVDAHILKWHPVVNLLGLRTAYELDRIAGRYDALADERSQEHTIYAVAAAKPVDLFDLARRYRLLRPLVDAQYGSATFIGARQRAIYEVRVSTTGLLVRPAPPR